MSMNSEGSTTRLHRIRQVRLQEESSLRAISRKTGTSAILLRYQECESSDIRLSDLAVWARALGVPVVELLTEPVSDSSETIRRRAGLVRAMKTVKLMLESDDSAPVRHMVASIERELIKTMPELKAVAAWHSHGRSRSADDIGRAGEPQHVRLGNNSRKCVHEECLVAAHLKDTVDE